YSVTKSVVGALIGIALKDGLLDSTDNDPTFARHDIGFRLDRARRPTRIRPCHGTEWELAAVPSRSSHGQGAGNGIQLQQRKQPPPVSHLDEAYGSHCTRLRARKAVRASRHRRRRVAARPAEHFGRRLWPLPAAARHGEDWLSLPAQRYVE